MLDWTEGDLGVDEAGRGPLAGPVVVAAALLPPQFDRTGLNDSKKLTAGQRQLLFERIQNEATWSIAIVDSTEVDRVNILRATLAGMRSVVAELATEATRAVIDGNALPYDLPLPAEAWVKGDGRHASIAAASILAKVTRDTIMIEADAVWPEYGFAGHKGYCCPEHFSALRQHGPCPIHRRSFAPVSEVLLQPCLFSMN
jgi:ribonuclease HII